MRKKGVIQLAIIILALVLGFFSIQYILSSLINLGYTMMSGSNFGEGYFIPSLTILLTAFVQGVVCWLLIKKSSDAANFIYDLSSFNASLKVNSNPVDLLFILLVVLGIYFLLSELPAFIEALIAAFRTKAPHSNYYSNEYVKPKDWLHIFLSLLLPAILLMFSKPIAIYFAKDLSDAAIEITGSKDENHYLDNTEE
jgi:hypothetical protein